MTKLYQVVNEDDEIIGHKLREEIDRREDIYRISALWLTNSKGEVLTGLRTMTKDKDPGKWGPAAAGTLEEGEEYETNIYKEAEEELGLTDVQFKKGPKHIYNSGNTKPALFVAPRRPKIVIPPSAYLRICFTRK